MAMIKHLYTLYILFGFLFLPNTVLSHGQAQHSRLWNAKWKINVNFPEKITEKFIWKGLVYALEVGPNTLSLCVK